MPRPRSRPRSPWLTGAAILGLSCAERTKVGATTEAPDGRVGATAHAAPSPLRLGRRCDLREPPKPDADGKRRLALIVGVGQYQAASIPDLQGPPVDVDRVYTFLTEAPGGPQIPKQNVCALTESEATLANLRAAWKDALVDRSRQGDTAYFYFSGHGTQVPDRDRDEPDERDEAFLVADSWTNGVGTLRDDEFHGWLTDLHRATDRVIVLLDACTSGSLTRSIGPVARRVIRDDPPEEPNLTTGDGGYLSNETLTGIVVLAAARDGSVALEPGNGEGGYFTTALLEAWRDANPNTTWGLIGRQIPRRIEQLSSRQQFPLAQGALDRTLGGGEGGGRANAWEVVKTGDLLTLEGPPLFGWGEGAEILLFPGDAAGTSLKQPSRSIARAKLVQFDGIHTKASLLSTPTRPIQAGDLAVLGNPAPASFRLTLSFDPALPAVLRERVLATLRKEPGWANLIGVQEKAAFQIRLGKDGGIEILGPEGAIRNQFPNGEAMIGDTVHAILGHARQQALLSVRGAAGNTYQDQQTLEVRAVRREDLYPCARPGWRNSCPGEEQQIPACSSWTVEVRNRHATDTLRVGGLILSNDGQILSLPADGRIVDLPPQGPWVAIDPGQTFTAVPPFGTTEDILVFGTQTDTQINWSALTSAGSATKGTSEPQSLEGQLTRLLGLETKAVAVSTHKAQGWTVSHLPFRAVPNLLPETSPGACPQETAKEYTIARFDVGPYRPRDPKAALSRVLDQAEFLTHASANDGVKYKQHDWSKPDDAANLAVGIDCSRSIWFAFTRAGLPYTSGKWHQGFQPTAAMFDKERGTCNPSMTPTKTLMHEQFDDCLGKPFETGDVLVWQGRRPGTDECVGHTVMVIDPQAFIGWGSHGWDGSKDDAGVRQYDTGVEYQQILAKTWNKWDRKELELKACWRHRAFTQQTATTTLAQYSVSSCDAVNECR